MKNKVINFLLAIISGFLGGAAAETGVTFWQVNQKQTAASCVLLPDVIKFEKIANDLIKHNEEPTLTQLPALSSIHQFLDALPPETAYQALNLEQLRQQFGISEDSQLTKVVELTSTLVPLLKASCKT